MPRKKPIVEKRLRLYRGRNPDDEIIRWLDQFDGAGHGIESNAIKEALYRGISGSGDGGQLAAVSASVDLAEIRQVVESAVTQGLARFEGQIGGTVVSNSGEDEEAEELLDSLGGALVLMDDDDD